VIWLLAPSRIYLPSRVRSTPRAEPLILFVINNRVGLGIGSKSMTMQQVCTLGLLVLRHIEQCFVVCSPDDIVNPLSGIRQKGSRAKVFDMQLVLAKKPDMSVV